MSFRARVVDLVESFISVAWLPMLAPRSEKLQAKMRRNKLVELISRSTFALIGESRGPACSARQDASIEGCLEPGSLKTAKFWKVFYRAVFSDSATIE